MCFFNRFAPSISVQKEYHELMDFHKLCVLLSVVTWTDLLRAQKTVLYVKQRKTASNVHEKQKHAR